MAAVIPRGKSPLCEPRCWLEVQRGPQPEDPGCGRTVAAGDDPTITQVKRGCSYSQVFARGVRPSRRPVQLAFYRARLPVGQIDYQQPELLRDPVP
jgi:hypothetical protein